MNCRELSLRGLGEFVIDSGSNQVVAFAIPLIAGLVSLAAVRAGQIAAGPLNVLWTSASVLLLPWFSKLSRNTEIREIPARWLWSSALAFSLLGLMAALALAGLPDNVGEAVLGASWSQGSSLAPLFCVQAGVEWVKPSSRHFSSCVRMVTEESLPKGVASPGQCTGAHRWCFAGGGEWHRLGNGCSLSSRSGGLGEHGDPAPPRAHPGS